MKEFIEQLRQIMWNAYNAEIHDVDITDGIPFKLGAETTAPALYETAKREIRNSIWHDTSEKPTLNTPLVLLNKGLPNNHRQRLQMGRFICCGKDNKYRTFAASDNGGMSDGFIEKWAYLDDLLPIE